VYISKICREVQVPLNPTLVTDTLHEDLYTFMITSRSFNLRMKNASNKSRRENQNTFFMFNYLLFENRDGYEIMWAKTVQPGRPQLTIWRMRTACRITKATNTHSEYVLLITFPLQQWLHERAPVLRYTYIDCLYL
jgi:hypothetical protein